MPQQLLQNYSIQVEQKLYAKETPQGQLAVYRTSPFGMMLTMNDQVVISENDGFLYHEMLAHPTLFTHPHPQKIAIIGNCFGILEEVLKHASVTQVVCIVENEHIEEAVAQYFSQLHQTKHDRRVAYHVADPIKWFAQYEPETFDIIIQSQVSENFLKEHYQHYHHALRSDGMLVQPCQSSLLHPNTLKPIFQNILHAGFRDGQTLNFPQPSYPSGWRTVMMATKNAPFKRIREKDIFNRSFSTHYYNFDTHKAALSLPELWRKEMEFF